MRGQQVQTQTERGKRTMTILCENCRKPIRTESCISRCPAASVSRREIRTTKPFRSTKGASKARRDQINAELQNLRSLLPILEQEKERLSYLHTMALVCFYIRETQLFPSDLHEGMGLSSNLATSAALKDPELLLSLPGFILAFNANGKLAHVSENVSHFLGFSVVELLAHTDSIFDLLNSPASGIVQEKLCFAQQNPGTEIEFITEMRTLRAFRVRYGRNRLMAVRGRFLMLNPQSTSSSPALTFVAFCTPVTHLSEDVDVASKDSSFQSQHTLDMKIVEMTDNVIYHLGYQKEELVGQSWYRLLHPEDTGRAVEIHRTLISVHDSGRHIWHTVVRLLCKDLSWAWVRVLAIRENGKGGELITCTNHILREEEALYLRNQDTQRGAVSPAIPNLQCNSGEIQPQTTVLNEASFFPQEPVAAMDGAHEYNPSQLLEACEEKMLPSALQSLFPTNIPLPNMRAEAGTLQPPQETGLPFFPAGGPQSLSSLDNANRLPSMNPYVLCSPGNALPPDSSPPVDISPLFEGGPSIGMFPTTGTSPDPDRWAISMLAGQIHSLAEIFSQYAKQAPQKSPGISLWPRQSAEDTHMIPRQGLGTNRALDFPEDLSVDEDVIASILNSFLDPNHLNPLTSELGSESSFHALNAEPQASLTQAPQTDATPCLDQCLFLHSSSASASTHVPDSQWDGRFHTVFQQGVFPEEAMFC
ncbi:neuronal PAS domain-containing protein 4-like [Podarcis raffonei]|uniref:neuronal PAS domain-containing protein 4-like n=1 Tax=Podarcis raffonei TaxID=65483 RepID=UPI0023297042|nr:neuronal PAS domain-containing protein 4-like [Podarcis raffonei]